MPSCLVCGRTRNEKSKLENVTFHRFPSKDYILQKWHGFLLCNMITVENIKKSSRICSCHFVPDSFIVNDRNRLLKRHAVPTIMISRLRGAKIKYPEIKKVISLPALPIHSNNLKFDMKRTLVKVSACSEMLERVSPLTDGESIDASKSESFTMFLPAAKVSKTIESLEKSLLSADVDQSMMSTSESLSLSSLALKKKKNSLFATPSEDIPEQSFLKCEIRKLSRQLQLKNKKLKKLQQVLCCKDKKIASLSAKVLKLKNKNLTNDHSYSIIKPTTIFSEAINYI